MFTPRTTAGLLVARFLSFDFAIATCLGLWHLLDLGTCAAGGPFAIAQECPDQAMTWALVLGAGMAGGIISSIFTGFAWGWTMLFVPTGATALAYALTSDGSGLGGASAAWIIGPLFLLMSLPVALYALREAIGGGDTPHAAELGGDAAPVPVTPAAPSSRIDQLARLDALKAVGVLTETEYAAQRRALGG